MCEVSSDVSEVEHLRARVKHLTRDTEELERQVQILTDEQQNARMEVDTLGDNIIILDRALSRVRNALREAGYTSKLLNENNWDSDAHIEVTLTIADCRAIFRAEAFKEKKR